MLEKVLFEYAEKFNDNFPIFYVKQMEENEIIELVQAAIDNNIPYVADYQEDVDY